MKHLNILVADDEKPVTTSVSFVLKRAGHTVDEVHDGDQALDRITKQPGYYHILITDHIMVKMSGLDLLARLRNTDFNGKIIVLSGNLTTQLEEEYRKLGAEKIIHKPFELSELREAVEELGAAMEPLTKG
jgi:CheY-like chemotaxis protein